MNCYIWLLLKWPVNCSIILILGNINIFGTPKSSSLTLQCECSVYPSSGFQGAAEQLARFSAEQGVTFFLLTVFI